MSEPRPTLRPEYFDTLYTARLDPWRFATSPYERGKYSLTLKAMPSRAIDRRSKWDVRSAF
jgi:hypothetical protein